MYTSNATLEPPGLKDLIDALLDIIKAAAGLPRQFELHITLGEGQDVPSATVESVNKLLEDVSADLRLKL